MRPMRSLRRAWWNGRKALGADAHPLHYWPPTVDLAEFKRAFTALGLGVSVIPRAWAPGKSSRVLAIGERVDHLVDQAVVKGFDDPNLASAILWVIYKKKLERGPLLVLDQLREVFGDVTEIFE